VSVVLRTVDLSVRYGGVRALTDCNLEVREGQVFGLIGPNGAGKTTFIDAVTGFAPSTGAIELLGSDLRGAPAHVRARRGLMRTWQSGELFEDMTVEENLSIAAGRGSVRDSLGQILRGRSADRGPAREVLAQLRLSDLGERLPGDLSQGHRKLIDVARALVGTPRVVCLDEPAAGLDTQESQALGERLRTIARGGVPLLRPHRRAQLRSGDRVGPARACPA
jgi:branched-chain amino acid transport system ATP-binding protein